jgi:uncharacterized protein YjiS (DUF1127 family)
MLTDQRLLPDCAGTSHEASRPGWTKITGWLRSAWSNARRPWPADITHLSDDMLLDIGIDPRQVPNPAGDFISRPDLSRNGTVLPIWRTTVKS